MALLSNLETVIRCWHDIFGVISLVDLCFDDGRENETEILTISSSLQGRRVVTLISLRDHPEYPFPDVLKRLAEEKTFAEAVARDKARAEAPKLALPTAQK